MSVTGSLRVCATIEYEGTRFNGWQVQPGKERTVQGDIERALFTIFKKRIRIHGSGRTDSGVHASGQTASFAIPASKPLGEVYRALNGNLPPDIVIVKLVAVPEGFHARYSAKSKRYAYTIINRKARSALKCRQALFVEQRLNVALMRREAKALIGKHDFRSFAATDRSKKNQNTIRTLHEVSISRRGDVVRIELAANGFLYKMVRNIVGVLLAVGQGRLPAGSVKSILHKKDRRAAPETAPPQGLCLQQVSY